MRIVRYIDRDISRYGILDGNIIRELKGELFSKFSTGDKVAELKEVELISPVEPPNVIAIGLNYKKHAEESGADIPERPVVFLKATSSLTGPGDEIRLPVLAPDKVDFEAELAVVIGDKAKNIEVENVSEYILGYTCANDVTARDCQRRIDKQWARAKSFDTFCPTGPWIETDLDPANCEIRSILNGKIMQSSNTSDMIFSVREIVSYLSKNMTLLPGTLILTGTPEGVGFAREEPIFLRDGDEIEIQIEGIGSLQNKVEFS